MNEYKTFEELKEELKDKYDKFMYNMNLELVKELDQYKNNWEELKKCLDRKREGYQKAHIDIPYVLNKMKELEENN